MKNYTVVCQWVGSETDVWVQRVLAENTQGAVREALTDDGQPYGGAGLIALAVFQGWAENELRRVEYSFDLED